MADDRVTVTSILGSEVNVKKDSVHLYEAMGFKVPQAKPEPEPVKAQPAKFPARKDDSK